ncbi:iron-containing alcohol dehydrogenase [Effusibacillus lacus]|uniref:Alcohol dehydrogenase n=1 Tax=Effusibacillus lacus TaxID=1348429 RepID=A0A292YH97_9BACL|nr:iron-containing alcohol dehydrogenase [Effusibacillus lacus]TCS75546.1 alcohol dehydrogenase [Effusibacillus lacus]GAX89008.1 alcohol dehydrogenase [Effusibacillus lacus]
MEFPISFFKNPTEIVYGCNSTKQLRPTLNKYRYKRVLVITDPGIVKAGLVQEITGQLEGLEYAVFDEVEPNPSVRTCEKAFALSQELKPDVLVGLGGGSAIDVAKVVGLLATNGGRVVDYEGIDTFSQPILPLIAIPTTAGTASEVTIFTVITDMERQYKLTIGGFKLAPRWALVDPLMTQTMPKPITASTGLDALVHAIESYTSRMAYPISKALAREAIRLISGNLRQAVYNGDQLEARDKMLMGSLLAGLAFNNTRLGNCHAMSHPVSAMFGVPHGVANSILIPHVMEFNAMAVPELFADIAEDMGENTQGLTIMGKAWKSVESVVQLSRDIGIPNRLSDFNVKSDKIQEMAQDAMKSGNILVNPRKTSMDDLVALYEKAM